LLLWFDIHCTCNKPVGFLVLPLKFYLYLYMPVNTTLKENVSIALQSLGGNKLRTSLTALIIAIGIMALVGILTAIEGIKQSTTRLFQAWGPIHLIYKTGVQA